MEYIIMGALTAIGWYGAKLVYNIVAELLMTRLHAADWYQITAGVKSRTVDEQPGEIKAVKNQIGFSYNREK
jgi:hypothetical protein